MNPTHKPAVPGFQWLRSLYDWVLQLSKHPHALKALAMITFIEASFFPIPTDPLLLAMGMSKPKSSLFYALVTTIFSVLGGLFGYFIGTFLWQYLSPVFIGPVFSLETFDSVISQFHNNVFLTIFIAGFSPVPFKVFTIAGGVASVPLLPFFLAACLSRGLRYFILGGLVFVFGEKIQIWIDRYFEKVTIGVSLALVLFVVLYKWVLH